MVIQPAHLVTLGIGLGIAISIFVLVRKNHLMASHAIWWLMVAVASVSFGVYPRLIDRVGAIFGIHYPPTLLIVIGIGFILIKMLTMDMKLTTQERKIRALTQRLAIVESEIFLNNVAQHDSVCESAFGGSDASDCMDVGSGSDRQGDFQVSAQIRPVSLPNDLSGSIDAAVPCS